MNVKIAGSFWKAKLGKGLLSDFYLLTEEQNIDL